ncbi:hypothetical protein [Pseudooceanicola marinus]|uniref:hypothetical protein n=1 Tax=Pseudooceanicola marinus TaxID=396013 RepID=UPI001CD3A50A|nr:hypothetical protein [Pseudooceanicola marinus]MCA1336865.1 hypothetical protein [Pseudooceanicola marinus]
MSYASRELIRDLGGYRTVAIRLGISANTLHSHMMAAAFPAKFFVALRALAVEQGLPEPSQELFSFVDLRGEKLGIDGEGDAA